jgi:hypothetical protein
VDVSFDPRDAGVLFLRPVGNNGFEKCRLVDSNIFYAHHSWADIAAARNSRAAIREEHLTGDMQQAANYRAADQKFGPFLSEDNFLYAGNMVLN